MLDFLPEGVESVLDIGCSSGAFGEQLRAQLKLKHLVGLEPNAIAAAGAGRIYDSVVTGLFPDDQDQLPVGILYDIIFFNDVLEHMINPGGALEAARNLLTSRGVVVASIPNIRHISVLGPLLVRRA